MIDAGGARAVTAGEVAKRLRGERRVVGISHEAPDGDALGCLSAFGGACDYLGVPCSMYIPGDSGFPPEYDFLPGLDRILRGDLPAVDEHTTIYFFDCASLLRSNSHSFPQGVARVNIDHHQDNPGYGDLNLVDPGAPSTSALLYEVLKAAEIPMEGGIATALYVGLVTDTGRFQYSNTTPGAHRMAAELQELGLDVNRVYRLVYESQPLPKLLLLERALKHLDVRLDGALAISWLGNDDFREAGADEGHAEGLIDWLRGIHGVRAAALVRERIREGKVECKVSLRSTDGDVDVSAIARLRGGGGHARAAGCTCEDDVSTVIAWVEERVAMALGSR
jgi:phosphoesterase RecJ-like protein